MALPENSNLPKDLSNAHRNYMYPAKDPSPDTSYCTSQQPSITIPGASYSREAYKEQQAPTQAQQLPGSSSACLHHPQVIE